MPRLSLATTIIRYGFFAIIILVIAGLAWWYFFLRAQESALETVDLGRGAGIAPPFEDTVGSNYGNITANLPSPTDDGTETSGKKATLPRLWQITKTPVAGAGFFVRSAPSQVSASLPAATSTAQAGSTVRFVERGTGYVLEADVKTGVLTRLTNTLVPRVYEALVAANGVVILRGIDETNAVVTSAGRATSTPATNEEPATLSLSELPHNIRTIALSHSGEEILYILEEPGGEASVMRAAWDGKKARRIGAVGVSGWHVHWLPDDRVVLVQNSGSGIGSSAYELGASGALRPLMRNVVGLALLPKTNSSAQLYSSGFALSARTGTDASVISLPIRTTADKCVWAPSANLIAYCAVPQFFPATDVLSGWLRGETHTADSWWRVDVGAGRAELLYTPSGTFQLDVENPVIDSSGNFVAFMNATDKSLWLLRVAE